MTCSLGGCRARYSWAIAGCLGLALASTDGIAQTGAPSPQRQPIHVTDLIQWSRFAGKGYAAVFTSPNQAEVALIVEHGDLTRNLVVSTPERDNSRPVTPRSIMAMMSVHD